MATPPNDVTAAHTSTATHAWCPPGPIMSTQAVEPNPDNVFHGPVAWHRDPSG
ncbi:hypothetical protein GCM10027186_35000 [Micromonospora schwarzwaldensis]